MRRLEDYISYVINLVNIDPSAKVIVVDEDSRPIGIITRRDMAFLEPLLPARKGEGEFVKRKRNHRW